LHKIVLNRVVNFDSSFVDASIARIYASVVLGKPTPVVSLHAMAFTALAERLRRSGSKPEKR